MNEYRTVRLRIPRLKVSEAITNYQIKDPEGAADVIRAFMKRENAPEDREVFGVLAVNARGRPNGGSIVAIGTLTACLVHPREVFRPLLRLDAAGAIVWHTHPSGDPTPSEEDFELHDRLGQAAEIIGIPIVDALVIAGSKQRSIGRIRATAEVAGE